MQLYLDPHHLGASYLQGLQECAPKTLPLRNGSHDCAGTVIGVGSGGGRGRLAPPSFKLGGHRPPNFTHCLHNEPHCSIVDRIACRHCSSRKSHFCCLKKCRPPPKSEYLPTPMTVPNSLDRASFQVQRSSRGMYIYCLCLQLGWNYKVCAYSWDYDVFVFPCPICR